LFFYSKTTESHCRRTGKCVSTFYTSSCSNSNLGKRAVQCVGAQRASLHDLTRSRSYCQIVVRKHTEVSTFSGFFHSTQFTAPSASVDAQPTSSGLRGTDCAQSAMFAALLFFQSQLCALDNTRTHHSIRQAMFCVTPCFPNGAACMQVVGLAVSPCNGPGHAGTQAVMNAH
jgi:hypothetical protein